MGKIPSLFRRRGRSKAPVLPPASPSGPAPAPATATAADDLERVFRKFDSNGDGRISSSELAAIIASLGHHPATDDEIARMMAEADADGDGFISLEEFMELNTPARDADEEDLRHAFAVFDRDHNGVISPEELARVMRGIGEAATVAQCRKMIHGVDQDGDGLVSFEEFRAMMTASSGGAAAAGALIAVAKAAVQ